MKIDKNVCVTFNCRSHVYLPFKLWFNWREENNLEFYSRYLKKHTFEMKRHIMNRKYFSVPWRVEIKPTHKIKPTNDLITFHFYQITSELCKHLVYLTEYKVTCLQNHSNCSSLSKKFTFCASISFIAFWNIRFLFQVSIHKIDLKISSLIWCQVHQWKYVKFIIIIFLNNGIPLLCKNLINFFEFGKDFC